MISKMLDREEIIKPALQKLTIRRIQSQDTGQYQKLRLKALTTDPDAFLATMEEEKARNLESIEQQINSDHILGAFLEDKLIGALSLIEQKPSKFNHIGILGGMYVDLEFRNLGIGRKLLEIMLDYVRSIPKFYSLQLKVVTTNYPALRLYESFGFTCWATEKNALFHKGKYADQHHYMLVI
jgi:RimJ/RimL family protein N-acetyltransferase